MGHFVRSAVKIVARRRAIGPGGLRLGCPAPLAGRQRDVLDHGAGGGEERAFVSVAPPHQVRRAAIGTVNFGDHAVPIGVADPKSLNHQFVADSCFHHRPPITKSSYFTGTRPRAPRTGTKAPSCTAQGTTGRRVNSGRPPKRAARWAAGPLPWPRAVRLL